MIPPTFSMPEWRLSENPVPYETALSEMESRIAAIRAGTASELLWALEHPPLYTAGTSASAKELISPNRFPVFETGRGGRYTYHGPGQLVCYALLDLRARGNDVRDYVCRLERWVIRALAPFEVTARQIAGRVGLWVDAPSGPAKIAAIGVRVTRGVTWHGLAINVSPDLSHFAGIIPCGIADAGVTSLAALGRNVTVAEMAAHLRAEFAGIFNAPPTHRAKIGKN